MTHVTKGVDSNGILVIDIIVSGRLPVMPDHAQVSVLPYTEDYIQTGPGKPLSKPLVYVTRQIYLWFWTLLLEVAAMKSF